MKELIEALKEFARVTLLAVIPVLIVQLEQDSINWKAVGMVAAIAALRAVDRYLHEYGKAHDNRLKGGLTGF